MKIYSCMFRIFKLIFSLCHNFELIFFNSRPLIKLTDRLLLVGKLRNEDVIKLLVMINPETWDLTFDKGYFLKIEMKLY